MKKVRHQKPQPVSLMLARAVFDRDVSALDEACFLQAPVERNHEVHRHVSERSTEETHRRHRRRLRARREWPSRRCAPECGQQFPPSDGDRHTPLPCEVRKGNDTTSRESVVFPFKEGWTPALAAQQKDERLSPLSPLASSFTLQIVISLRPFF
jgi:hypothetical protein